MCIQVHRDGEEDASTSEPLTSDESEAASTASQDTHSHHSAPLAGSGDGSPTARQAVLPAGDLTPAAVVAATAAAAAEAPELQQLSSGQQQSLAVLLDTAILKVRPLTLRTPSASWSEWLSM